MQILNQEGNSTWPMAHLVYFVSNRSFITNDCTLYLEFFKFLSWMQVNDHINDLSGSLGFIAPSNAYRVYYYYYSPTQCVVLFFPDSPYITLHSRAILATLHTATCNGVPVFNTSYIVGTGSAVSIFSEWADFQASASLQIKYYSTSSGQGVTDTAKSTS